MAVALDFRVLGPLEVWREGVRVELGAAKQRAVLAVLLIRRSEVARDVLVEAVWGERPPAGARNTLQVYVSRLRQALGREVIETTSSGYRLSLASGVVDAERFEQLFGEGREALAGGDAGGAQASLRNALALWRGPAFADLRYEAFTQAEAGRLEELRLACVEERIEAELALGRSAELVAELEALILEHPLRERLRGQLIVALYRSGRQSEALAQYRATRRMLADELGLEPSPELRELERMILAHDPGLAAPGTRPRSNLPLQPTPFLGREEELAEIVGLARGGSRRLLTLTGPGGSGKTRLAIETARALVDDFPDGVYWAPLQSLRDPKLVLPTVAGAVDAKGDLTRHIGDRHLLVLADNCEHLPAAANDLASLLSACPNLLVLATSREPLHVAAEREYQVRVMSEEDAVSLFRERAYRAEPIETVRAICEKLDCLPLAIELAAARTKTIDLDDVLVRLDRRLEFLTGGPRDAPARQQTLRSTIEWSYDLLSPEEQRVYAGFAVFRAGAAVPAAEAVCQTDRDALDALFDRHLLNVADDRYTMLETIREHARERLEDGVEADAIRAAHARWFLGAAEEFAAEVPNAITASLEMYQRWIPRIEADLDNFRAAMRWSIDQGDKERALRIAIALTAHWARGGPHGAEGASWLDEALGLTGMAADPIRARAHYLLGMWLYFAGRSPEAEQHLQEALELYSPTGEKFRTFQVLRGLAMVALAERDLQRARRFWGEAADLRLDDQQHLVDGGLAQIELEEGNLARARELLERGLHQVKQLGYTRLIGDSALHLAYVDLLEGSYDRAERGYRESLEVAHAYAFDPAACWAVGGLAAVAAKRGDLERAGRLWGAVQALERDIHYLRVMQDGYAQILDPHAEPEFLYGLEEGRMLSLEQAVAYVLGESA